MFRWRCIWI